MVTDKRIRDESQVGGFEKGEGESFGYGMGVHSPGGGRRRALLIPGSGFLQNSPDK